MTLPEPIDLLHRGLTHNVGCYLVETDDGIALFDCGPTPCIPALEAGLADRGLELGDVSHLLLSHIHFDHAGATGALVRANPSLQVHVSAVGAPHLVEPSRLEASARRLYGDTFDALWGELVPVPAENIHVVGDVVLGLQCFPSTGHASHHVSMLHDDGTLYAGDSMGVRIAPARSREIRARGARLAPLRGSERGGGMWNWKPAKAMLDRLWNHGDLVIAGRQGFQRLYDLPERVIPKEILDAPVPTDDGAPARARRRRRSWRAAR